MLFRPTYFGHETSNGSNSVITMLVRILRRLTLEEVEKQVKELGRIHGVSFDEFEEQLLTAGKVEGDSLETYLRWARLVNAYRGYMEDGELHCVVEELHELGLDELRAFSPRRLELLYALSDLRAESINDLARRVRRNVKNVYQDLQVLNRLGFVNLSRKRRKVVPELLVEEITFIAK